MRSEEVPEMLSGEIERIIYHNAESGFTIARLIEEGAGRRTTVVGSMASVREGELVTATGKWTNHPRYGKQFQIESYRETYPSTEEGIRRFLASGLIKGIGPVSAQRIVDHFGTATMDVIDNVPERLIEVPGLGRSRVATITRVWEEHCRVKNAMVFLQSHGVTTGLAVKICRQYGDDAVRRVRENPYQLEQDVRGIGFRTADGVAERLGICSDAPERVKAGVRFLLDQATSSGHVFLPTAEVLAEGVELLGVDEGDIQCGLESLRRERLVVTDADRNYLPALYHAEGGIVSSLARLVRGRVAVELAQLVREDERKLARRQRRAIELAVESKVLVLTGGPGTGKTTITRAILGRYQQHGLEVALCSPTGRAAKRLAETAGREAKTIHRLLEFAPGEGVFRKGVDDQLAADAVIVDEASMIDLILMNALLRALPDRCRLVLVGDVDQLPSVGAGNVLGDIIASGKVPVVRLTEIFRQEKESQIVANAHRINQGQVPVTDNRSASDFFFIEEAEPERTVDLIEDLCFRRLPGHGGWDPIREIQVITPMYRGPAGANNLNQRLQQRFNPESESLTRNGVGFKVGDKVMQVRNNYDKGVFNGDMGMVASLDAEANRLDVAFDTVVGYEAEELEELMLAYAISTHRSQGAEFPAVIIPLMTQHYVMLQRNLLYTAVTRAREFIVIVGTGRALNIAVANDAVALRHCNLGQRLAREIDGALQA